MNFDDFKNSVFDEEVLLLCLKIFEALDLAVDSQPIVRQAVLDSLAYSSKIEDVNEMLETLKFIPSDVLVRCKKEILDCHRIVGFKREMPEYLMTIRHLGASKKFIEWEEFFLATKTAWTEEGAPSDYFLTVRYLITESDFTCWKEFFTLMKRIKLKSSNTQRQVLESIRHAVRYFNSAISVRGVLRLLAETPQYSEAFALGQLDSKQWLIEEAIKCWGKNWGKVFVLAGWVGVLPRMIYETQIETSMIRSFDIDEEACRASEFLNQAEVQNDWRYKSSILDITKAQYPTFYKVRRKDGSEWEGQDLPDVVINTSCEHIADISSWWSQIPKGTKVILQSNDGFHIPEHVACFKTLNDFEKAMGLSRIDYRGEKALPEFNRFMLIGIK